MIQHILPLPLYLQIQREVTSSLTFIIHLEYKVSFKKRSQELSPLYVTQRNQSSNQSATAA